MKTLLAALALVGLIDGATIAFTSSRLAEGSAVHAPADDYRHRLRQQRLLAADAFAVGPLPAVPPCPQQGIAPLRGKLLAALWWRMQRSTFSLLPRSAREPLPCRHFEA